ncbi:MAG: WG repeat-containing protein [Oscillospiraceae bacterium]|nr:WG repeat-containing protein [Oscillospiraceae bacterium]
MKRTTKKFISFSTAIAVLANMSLISAFAEYDVETVADCKYDELMQMRDKSILIENGSDDSISDETELIIIDENGNKNIVSKNLGIKGIYNYVSTTMGEYNYISPTPADYSFDFRDAGYRISTEQDVMIVGIGDKYALMNNDGEIVSEKYNNIYYSGNGYYVVDEASPDSYYDSEKGDFIENKSGLIKSDGSVFIEPHKGVSGYYITSDGEHFMVDTESGDYFIDNKGNTVSDVYDKILVTDTQYTKGRVSRIYTCEKSPYIVTVGDKQALMNENFEVYTDFYDDFYREGIPDSEKIILNCTDDYYYDGYIVTLNNKKALIDLEGNYLFNFSDDLSFEKCSGYNYDTETTIRQNFWIQVQDNTMNIYDEQFNLQNDINVGDYKIGYKKISINSECSKILTVLVRDNNNKYKTLNYVITDDGSVVNFSDYDIDYYNSYIVLDNGNFIVKDKKTSVLKAIDIEGNTLQEFDSEYTRFSKFNNRNNSHFVLSTNGSFSVYDSSLNVIYDHIAGAYYGDALYYGTGVYGVDGKYGILSLKSGVVFEPVYDEISFQDEVYLIQSDNDIKVVSASDFEELYSVPSGYNFVSVTPSSVYWENMNSRITFNGKDTETGESSTIVYNFEKREVEYQQTGLYDYVSAFINGYAIAYIYSEAESDDLWTSEYNASKGLIDIEGNEIVPCSSDISININSDFHSIYINNIDISFEEIDTEFSRNYGYSIAKRVGDNTYLVLLNGKWGLASPENKILLTPEYEYISDFDGGFAEIILYDETGDHYGAVTINGKIIVDPIKDDCCFHISNGIVYTRPDYSTLKNFKDYKATEIMNEFCEKYGYDLAKQEGDFYYVEKDGKAGIVTSENEIVIPIESHEILSFNSTEFSLRYVQERFQDILTNEYTSKLRKTSDGSYLVSIRNADGKIGIFKISETTLLGDINGDNIIDASDASSILAEYALMASGKDVIASFSEAQKKSADVNKDGVIDASDASSVLAFYAYQAANGQMTAEEFFAQN